jgi:hypothetical protein
MTNFDVIKQLITGFVGQDRIALSRETRIFKDLRIDGEDAAELLRTYSNELKVDMSTFPYNEYFSPEGIDAIGAITGGIKRMFGKGVVLKELTLGDMEKAAGIGRWTLSEVVLAQAVGR